jgi:hypothetical protein
MTADGSRLGWRADFERTLTSDPCEGQLGLLVYTCCNTKFLSKIKFLRDTFFAFWGIRGCSFTTPVKWGWGSGSNGAAASS